MNKQYLDRPKGGKEHMICPLRVKKKKKIPEVDNLPLTESKIKPLYTCFTFLSELFQRLFSGPYIPRTHSLCREENRWRKGLGKSRVNSLRIKTSHAAKKLRALCLSLPPAVLLHCLPGKRPWYQDTGHHTKNCQGVLTGMSHEVSRANKAGKKKEKET